MSDWYDKVISTLGLDEDRMDRLIGIVERQLAEVEAPHGRETVSVTLNRLADGRRLLLFQVGAYSNGEFWPMPCSGANAESLGCFLRRAESRLVSPTPPEATAKGVLQSLEESFVRGRPVETMAPLPHRHLDARIELRLLAGRGGRHTLLLMLKGSRRRLHYRWHWTQPLAAQWQAILSGLQASLTDWPTQSETPTQKTRR